MTRKLRTISLAHDASEPIKLDSYRQWPGQWPCGNSLVGNSLFIPSANGNALGDWMICLTPPPQTIRTNVPKERRIFFALETPDFWTPPAQLLDFFGYVVTPYEIPGFTGVQVQSVTTGLFWWYGMNMDGHALISTSMRYDDILREPPPRKSKLLSTIVSAKTFLAGHAKRYEFTMQLKQLLGDKFDVFGHGINPIADKRDGLLPYHFHLAIENSVYPHYWTEKLSDPLLARCTVFYHGATRISDYFSPDVVIPIDIHKTETAVSIIESRLSGAPAGSTALEHARNELLTRYNFPHFCDQLINKLESNPN